MNYFINKIEEVWHRQLSEQEIDILLWECSCYPFGTEDQVIDNLKELFEKSDGDIERARTIFAQDMHAAFLKGKEQGLF